MTLPTGGSVLYRSLDDPDNARGWTVDGVVIDEAGFVKKEAWYDVIHPMLIDTNGWSLIMGTPNGMTWFWTEFMKAGEREDTRAWQIPTYGCRVEDGRLVREPHPLENPFITMEEMERIYESVPERTFRQEFLAEFIDDAGGVFRNVREMSTLDSKGAEAGADYVFGVDWARSYDWTVIQVINTQTKEQVWKERFNKIDYAVQVQRLEALYDIYQPSIIGVEGNSMGAPLIEILERTGLPIETFTTTNLSKKEVIEALALAIERGKLRLLADSDQIAELQAFHTQRLASGAYRYEAPDGMHDDCVMALAIAWHYVQMAGPMILTL